MATQNQENRQKLLERLRGRNPELNIDDDEAVSSQIASDYDEMEKRQQERDDFNKMLAENPYAAPIISGLVTGKNEDGTDFNLADWFLENEPDMLVDLIEGNAQSKEHYQNLRAQRQKDAEDNAALEAEAEEKLKAMDAELDAALEETGYRPEQARELMEWLFGDNGFIARARDFDLTKDDFIKIMRIKDYDSDIAKAGDDGYVRGKNEKIDMTQRRKQGTGLPVINGGGGSARRTDEDPQITRLNQMKDVY